jgi:hypothetical protein
MIWQDAIKWAEKAGGELPSRFDALTLFTNLKSEFKEEWYWTSAQHASGESYAWMQHFGNGTSTTTARATTIVRAPSAE